MPYHSGMRNMELHLDLEIVDDRDGGEARRPMTDRIVHLKAADNLARAEAIGRLFERHPFAYAGIKPGEKIEGRRAEVLAVLLPAGPVPPGSETPDVTDQHCVHREAWTYAAESAEEAAAAEELMDRLVEALPRG
jgi:hypothetical protein